MSPSTQMSIHDVSVSRLAIIMLAIVFVTGLFLVGFDQGQTFSLVYGQDAYIDAYLHGLTHDVRHVAGFPCH